MRALSDALHARIAQAGSGSINLRADSSELSVSSELIFDWNVYLPALCGVLVLGIGDSMASLVGVWLGRIRWFETKRTVEGSLAAILCIMITVAGIVMGMDVVNTTLLDGLLHIIQPVSNCNTASHTIRLDIMTPRY